MPLGFLKQVGDSIAEAASQAVGTVGHAAGQARDAVAGAYDATRAAVADTTGEVAARATRARDLGAQATALLAEVPAVLAPIASVAGTTVSASATLTGSALRATPGALYRVVTFDGTMEGTRTGIVVPLLGHLRHIRDNRSDPDLVARGIGELAVFAVEAALKSRVLLQEQIGAGLWALFARSRPGRDAGDARAHLVTMIRDEVLAAVWAALRTPDLSLGERLSRLVSIEAACTAAVGRATDTLALYQLDADVSAWQQAHYRLPLSEPDRGEDGALMPQPERRDPSA